MKRVVCVLLIAACSPSNRTDPPQVQMSSGNTPSRTVTVTDQGNFSPPCLVVALGDTVEWYNPNGQPINVTSAATDSMPPLLFSPSLVNSAMRWRHTFTAPGRVDYASTSSGATACNPEYGPCSSTAMTSASGAVCVKNGDGTGCEQVCCIRAGSPTQCGGGACTILPDPQISYGFCAASPVDAGVTD
jgi:plastocyanin